MYKTVFKYLFNGISWGCTFFIFINLIGAWLMGDSFLEPIKSDFQRQIVGAIIVGVFSGSTSIIYLYKKIPLWIQIAIHTCIGLASYFVTAYYLGWMPLNSYGEIFRFILCWVLIFWGIWIGFYFYNKHEVKKVNNKIQELKSHRNKN